ncbi:unnamed protein product [Caretta caretta]
MRCSLLAANCHCTILPISSLIRFKHSKRQQSLGLPWHISPEDSWEPVRRHARPSSAPGRHYTQAFGVE